MTGTETLWRPRIITLGPEGRSGWEPLSRPSRTDKKEAKSVTETGCKDGKQASCAAVGRVRWS